MSFWHLAVVAATLALSAPAYGQTTLTLDEALRLAEVDQPNEITQDTRNPRLIGPRADADAARSLVGQARLRPNPDVSFEAENIAGSGAFSGLRATEYTLAIGQRLELGGKRGARVDAAQAQVRLADLRADLTEAQLSYLVRDRYVQAAAAEARVALARDIVERSTELARIAGVLVEVGREPPLRALRADAALARARAELEAAEATSLAARSALASLWGGQGPPPLVSGDFPDIRPPLTITTEAAGLQLDVARAERLAASADIEVERTLRVPDPVVSAGIRRFEETNDTAFVVGVSIPLPFRNRNDGNIAAAGARLRAASAREAVVLADFEQEVMRARSQYLAAEARADTLANSSLPQADEALRLVRIGYRNGRFPLIEVLDAAQARDAIREALIAARQDRGLAAAELIRLAAQ